MAHRDTERSKTIIVNREYKETGNKLISVHRKRAGSSASVREKNTRYRNTEEGKQTTYSWNDILIVPVETRNQAGRKETEWHIKASDGKLIKKADSLGICWKYLESNHRI